MLNGILEEMEVLLLKRFIFPGLITVGIICLLFTQISLYDLYNLLGSMDPLWVLMGFAAYLLGLFFRALRFRWLIHSMEIPLFQLFRITVFYNLSLMVLPSRLGEISYPYLLNKFCGMNVTEGMASLIASRVYDFFTILIISLVALIGTQSLFKINLALIIPFVVLLGLLTFLAFLYMNRLLRFLSNTLGGVFQWFGLEKNNPSQWCQKKIDEMADHFSAIKTKKAYFPITLMSLASWTMTIAMFYGFLRGFGVSISLWKVVFGSTVAIIANAFPVSGVGNWGILEAGWTAGFLVVGLSKVRAIATGLGVHIIMFLSSVVVAFFCWVTLTAGNGKALPRLPRE